MKRIIFAVFLVGCADKDITPPPDPVDDPDPLTTITSTAAPGSLDDIHERIISKRCSGQPGLCHNGQFEPNLSTPALMYEYVVNRPGLEKADRLRAKPGSAIDSLIIDKIRNRNGVATQMPLGAEPLEETDIQAIEAWIDGGALRRPGADPAPNLNNPPKRPEIAIFNNAGTRLDGTGPIKVNVGDTLVIRHSVQDFETADSAIPFAAILLDAGNNQQVVLNPTDTQSPQVGPTTFDGGNPPLGKGDTLDYKRSWTITNPLSVRDQTTGAITTIDPHGKSINVLALYIDSPTMGIVGFDTTTQPIEINP